MCAYTRKRLYALLAGIALAACVIAAAFALMPAQGNVDKSLEYGYIYSGSKSSSVDFVHAATHEDGLVYIGSSELSTPAATIPQVPAGLWAKHSYGVPLMLVGEAYDQCLWQTIALGALAKDGLPRNKVVLSVGLGQFVDGGMDAESFKTRLSYSLLSGFADNGVITDEARAKVRERVLSYGMDESLVSSCFDADPLARINRFFFSAADDLRLRKDLVSVRAQATPPSQEAPSTPDFAALRKEALAEAQAASTSNSWGLEDGFYKNQLEPALEGLKGARAGETYSDTPEYDDLDLLLDVCEQCGVEPLIVLSPSCGPYYDYIGIDAQTRRGAYDKILAIAKSHGVAVADFSDREYEQYFLFDIVHFGWTGWIDVEEAIYKFATEG